MDYTSYDRQSFGRLFNADSAGNITYFPWGPLGSGYIIPSAQEKEAILERNVLRMRYLRSVYWGLILFGIYISSQNPQSYAWIVASTFTMGAVFCTTKYVDARKSIKRHKKTSDKFQDISWKQKTAQAAAALSFSKIIPSLIGSLLISLLGIYNYNKGFSTPLMNTALMGFGLYAFCRATYMLFIKSKRRIQ